MMITMQPIIITALMSVLFIGQYNPAHTIALLTGLIFFFFGADCARHAGRALKNRRVHYYFIPLIVLRSYVPSLIALAAVWFSLAPFTPHEFFSGIIAVAAGLTLIWGTVWGISAHISKKTANKPLFMPALHYGLNFLMILTPVFYQLNAVRSPALRMALGYSPVAAAILTARAALVRGTQSALPPHAFTVAAAGVSTLVILGWLRSKRTNPS